MPAGMVIDGQIEGTDICALSHTAAKPIIVAVDDGEVFFSKMMAFTMPQLQ